MKSHRRLFELLRLARCWGDDPPDELAQRIEEERKRVTPPQDVMETLAILRQAWVQATVSQKRNRHIFFLGSVYDEVWKWRRLKRQDDLLAGLREHFEVHPDRDVFQALLFVTCGGQDRRIRSSWAACLRTIDRRKTPPDLGAAQIIRLGGINSCSMQ